MAGQIMWFLGSSDAVQFGLKKTSSSMKLHSKKLQIIRGLWPLFLKSLQLICVYFLWKIKLYHYDLGLVSCRVVKKKKKKVTFTFYLFHWNSTKAFSRIQTQDFLTVRLLCQLLHSHVTNQRKSKQRDKRGWGTFFCHRNGALTWKVVSGYQR